MRERMEKRLNFTGKYNPKTCNESTEVGGSYICKLEFFPCPLTVGRLCALEKLDAFQDAFVKYVKGEKE